MIYVTVIAGLSCGIFLVWVGYQLGSERILNRWNEEQKISEKEYSDGLAKWQSARDDIIIRFHDTLKKVRDGTIGRDDCGKLLATWPSQKDGTPLPPKA